MFGSIGARLLPVLPQVMRLRRAVLQIPTKSSVPPRSLLHKHSALLTRAESTLLQVFIPRHFNSFRCNTYKKLGEGPLVAAQEFSNSSLPNRRSCARTATPATPIPSCAYSQLSSYPGWGVRLSNSARTEERRRQSSNSSPRPRASRADSRYTTGAMLNTTVLDTNWLGRPRSIGAVLAGIRRPSRHHRSWAGFGSSYTSTTFGFARDWCFGFERHFADAHSFGSCGSDRRAHQGKSES